MVGADLRLNSSFRAEALGPGNAWRNGTARSGLSFCFSGKYPNCSNADPSWGKIIPVEETGFHVEFKPEKSFSSLAAGLGRVPARARVLTSSDEGKAKEGLCSYCSTHLRVLSHFGRWVRRLEDCFTRNVHAMGTEENPAAS